MKSRRMRWAGYVARMGEEGKLYKVLVGKPEGKRPLGHLGVGGKVESEWILGRYAGRILNGFNWFGIGESGGLL
jgi:hypothetical protein